MSTLSTRSFRISKKRKYVGQSRPHSYIGVYECTCNIQRCRRCHSIHNEASSTSVTTGRPAWSGNIGANDMTPSDRYFSGLTDEGNSCSWEMYLNFYWICFCQIYIYTKANKYFSVDLFFLLQYCFAIVPCLWNKII
jgi:hypothetical protein